MAAPAQSTGLMNLEFVTVETFVIQFIILLVVLWVLNKFVFKPYLAYLDEWEAKQTKVQEDYNNAEKILEEKRQQGDAMLAESRAKGNAVIEEAESLAKEKKEKIIADAELGAQTQMTAAKAQIEQERQSMMSNVKGSVMDMALKLNEKLFKDEKVSKDFLKKHIDTL